MSANAAPAKFGQFLLRLEQFGPDWIQMHVVAGCSQIATPTAIDRQGFVAAAKEVAEDFVPPIESDG